MNFIYQDMGRRMAIWKLSQWRLAQDAGVNCVCFCWRRDAGDQQEGCGGEPHYPGGGITGRADD